MLSTDLASAGHLVQSATGLFQYITSPANETHKVECGWTDTVLGSVSCAYSTAENMLHRARVRACDKVLMTDASGGVGAAAIRLAKRQRDFKT